MNCTRDRGPIGHFIGELYWGILMFSGLLDSVHMVAYVTTALIVMQKNVITNMQKKKKKLSKFSKENYKKIQKKFDTF
jgi:ABC-type dipeptide/oligopeptide/nickel transport system ATPase subunit